MLSCYPLRFRAGGDIALPLRHIRSDAAYVLRHSITEVLLRLSLKLPRLDDRLLPHFCNLFVELRLPFPLDFGGRAGRLGIADRPAEYRRQKYPVLLQIV